MSGRKEVVILLVVAISLLAPVSSKFKFRKKKYAREEFSSESSSDFEYKAAKGGNIDQK